MQVKISYTAEISDVPKEVSNILNTLLSENEKIQEMVSNTKISLDNTEISTAKMQLSIIKETLQKMFARVTDCQVVIEGYENVMNQKSSKPPEQETQTQP